MERPAMAFNTLIPRAANLPQVGASAVRAAVSAPSFSSLRNCSVRGPCGLCRPDVPLLKGRAAATACGQSSRRARSNCAGVCMQTSPTRANGSGKPSPGSSTTTRCRPTVAPSRPSATTSSTVAAHAQAARSERSHDVEAGDEAGGRLAPQTTHPSSLANPAPYHQTSKVGAVCGKIARTVLCGGRAQQYASLPRSVFAIVGFSP